MFVSMDMTVFTTVYFMQSVFSGFFFFVLYNFLSDKC